MDLQYIEEFFTKVKHSSNSKIIEVLETDQQTIGQIIDGLMTEHFSSDAAELVFSNLFSLYQCGNDIQKAFVLHFLPALVCEYLLKSSNHNKGYGKLEAVLLAIYNAEVVDEDGEAKCRRFRLPSLSRPSLYHEPQLGKAGSSALTESALSRHEQSEVVHQLNGPGYQLTRIPACHRFAVIALVLEIYNMYISFMGEASLDAACTMALRIASCGFSDLCGKNQAGYRLESLAKCSRIPLDNATLLQLIFIVHYSMFNGFLTPAQRAFEALHFRTSHGLFPQAYLLTRSIQHLLESGGREALQAPFGITIHTTSTGSELGPANSLDPRIPRCLDGTSTSWKRRCPFEILLAERPAPEKFELDSPPKSKSKEGKLKIPKDSRPKKAKSWSSVSIGKPSPTASIKSDGESIPVSPTTPSGKVNEKSPKCFELVTGV